MTIQLEFYALVTEPGKQEAIWEILCEHDKEFIPSLSARKSSYQSQLQGEDKEQLLPHSYYEKMIKQPMLLAINTTAADVVGFMAFKHDYHCEELKNFSPSNYVTTICVKPRYRNQGITSRFYQMMLSEDIPAEMRMPYLSTRTWSSNDAHIHVLKSLRFSISERLIDHRGPGIDTLYFAKELPILQEHTTGVGENQ